MREVNLRTLVAVAVHLQGCLVGGQDDRAKKGRDEAYQAGVLVHFTYRPQSALRTLAVVMTAADDGCHNAALALEVDFLELVGARQGLWCDWSVREYEAQGSGSKTYRRHAEADASVVPPGTRHVVMPWAVGAPKHSSSRFSADATFLSKTVRVMSEKTCQ